MIEPLEGRTMLSHTHHVSSTRLTFSTTEPINGTIGSPIFQTVAAKITSNGLPLRAATVDIVVDGKELIGQGVSGRSGYVSLNVPSVFAGKHLIQAFFPGSTRYLSSQSRGVTVTANVPSLTTTADGLEWATVQAGAGAAVASGQTATVDYVGYLTDGTLFDSSFIHHPPGPIDFVLYSGSTIPNDGQAHAIVGFNELMTGMKPGEIRLGVLPASIAYGATPPQGSGIPANATLVFYVKLDAISG